MPERAGNVFKAEDVITFHLSANEIPLLNSKETFLRFYVEMTGNCKCQLDSRAAASAVIESMTILTGDQSTTLEEIDAGGTKNCKIRANFAVGRRALLRARGEAHPGARGRPRRGPRAHRRRDGQDADAGARRVLLRVGHKEANELFTLENE